MIREANVQQDFDEVWLNNYTIMFKINGQIEYHLTLSCNFLHKYV